LEKKDINYNWFISLLSVKIWSELRVLSKFSSKIVENNFLKLLINTQILIILNNIYIVLFIKSRIVLSVWPIYILFVFSLRLNIYNIKII
jgi:hypothetical protein